VHNKCQVFLCNAQNKLADGRQLWRWACVFATKEKPRTGARTGLFRFLWGEQRWGGKPIGTAQLVSFFRNCEMSHFAAGITVVGTLREGSSAGRLQRPPPASRLTRPAHSSSSIRRVISPDWQRCSLLRHHRAGEPRLRGHGKQKGELILPRHHSVGRLTTRPSC
jgi:hypothetical protein